MRTRIASRLDRDAAALQAARRLVVDRTATVRGVARDFGWSERRLHREITATCGEYIPDVRDFRTDDKVGLLKRVFEMTDSHTTYAKWLLKNKPWDFFMMVEMGTDRIHHGLWKYHDPTHHKYEKHPVYNDAIRNYYHYVDKAKNLNPRIT